MDEKQKDRLLHSYRNLHCVSHDVLDVLESVVSDESKLGLRAKKVYDRLTRAMDDVCYAAGTL